MLNGRQVGVAAERRSTIPGMRRLACTSALLIVAALPAVAEARQQIVATPPIVPFGKALTVRGSGWPVIEFCRRRVRIVLRTSQQLFPIGTARVKDNGR